MSEGAVFQNFLGGMPPDPLELAALHASFSDAYFNSFLNKNGLTNQI